ncbi:MAG: hypothetical protein AAB453_00890 [Patescibacteria group bacterium]
MPRIPRVDVGGEFYHVINRANARLPIFFVEEDFQLFENIMELKGSGTFIIFLATV